MGPTRKNKCFVSTRTLTVFILFIASLAHINALDGIRPTITPSDPDVSYLPTENHTFTCESTEPITWHLPIEDDAFASNLEIIDAVNGDNYESILKLNRIDHTFVGFYYCVKKDAVDANNEDSFRVGHASRIYLFVEDPLHPVYEPISPIIEGYEGQDVLIPCKPTSKLYSVKLVKELDEVRTNDFDKYTGFYISLPTMKRTIYQCKNDLNISDPNYVNFHSHSFERTFNAYEGFRVPLSGLTDGGYFSCHSQEDEDHVEHFHVVVHSAPSSLSNPKINLNTENYGIVGEDLEFNCTVDYNLDSKIRMIWELPNDRIAEKEGRVEITEPHFVRISDDPPKLSAVGHLKVRNVKKMDAGRYVCLVEDNANHSNKNILNVQQIIFANESFIDIEVKSNKFVLDLAANQTEAKWYVKFAGYPTTTIVWRDPNQNEIPWTQIENKNNKLEAMYSESSTILRIRHPKISDSGTYALHARNERMEKKQEFKLFVRETPHVRMSDVTIKPGEKAKAICDIFGYPISTVTWSYIPCENATFDPASCGKDSTKITFSDEIIKTIETPPFNQTSTLLFRPNRTGIVTCRAKNKQGSTTAIASVILSDLSEDLMIWTNNESPIAIGDDVFLTCGASAHKFSGGIEWFKDDVPIVESADNLTVLHITNNNTQYSYKKTLHWKSIPKEANGVYSCQANVIKDDSQEKVSWTLDLAEPTKAQIIDSNIKGKEMEHKLGEPLQMICTASGVPRPTIHWFKDNKEISTNKKILLHNDNTVLDMKYVTIEDEGNYKCVVSNRLGTEFRETNVKINDAPKVSKSVVIGVIVVILILVLCTIYLCLRIRRERRLFRELKAAGLADFERGNPDSINPELAVDEQADLLPYDKKYEFPREKIKLGKQLGAGAFGVVIKGYAHGIVPYEEETTVAVKMVKQMADNEVMRALISELKIMVHLGQHLNVVNLLGAVTKNIAKREVMVIVEYCRFGNLQNFLVKHREYFIDQIVRDRDIIDPNIMTKDQRWSNDSGYAYYSRPESDRQSLGAVSHANSAYIRHSNVNDYFTGGMDSANTEATLISRNSRPGGEENMVLSNNSMQPAWRSNYRMDYKGPARSVTTTDLLCWAFQVSRGMEYLASRKVLHGDLAARNILLCDDNVVKICDFGLARSMYKSDNYRKKGESPLPFKWLALESISDQIFSTYSDVWSFGIVLWELFSLGKVPYPGMDADQGLYFKLKDGYRMEKPHYATQDIYDIMLSCWCANPESRPLFNSLEKSIGKLLENGVAEHYIDLNEPYLKSNVTNFEEGHVDYLSCMAAPDCPPPAIPSYVNGHVGLLPQAPGAQAQASYITMNQPTVPEGAADTHDAHFQFPPIKANNLNAGDQASKFRTKISNIPEEIPMLKRSNQSIHSDSDTDANYVNVPTAISTKTDAVSNPGYVVVTNFNETKT